MHVKRGRKPHPESHEHDGERQGRGHGDGLKSAKAACYQLGHCDRSHAYAPLKTLKDERFGRSALLPEMDLPCGLRDLGAMQALRC